MMFFKYTRKRSGENSRFLFFNRNRASVDYRMTSAEYLPSFGVTGAISYNPPSWRGLAPVAVIQVFNRNLPVKAGVQYAFQKERVSIFTWLITETMHDPHIDLFFLGRFIPKLSEKTDLFLQAETLNSFATTAVNYHSFTQRVRLGVRRSYWQFGAGIDLTENGRQNLLINSNAGLFLRHEF